MESIKKFIANAKNNLIEKLSEKSEAALTNLLEKSHLKDDFAWLFRVLDIKHCYIAGSAAHRLYNEFHLSVAERFVDVYYFGDDALRSNKPLNEKMSSIEYGVDGEDVVLGSEIAIFKSRPQVAKDGVVLPSLRVIRLEVRDDVKEALDGDGEILVLKMYAAASAYTSPGQRIIVNLAEKKRMTVRHGQKEDFFPHFIFEEIDCRSETDPSSMFYVDCSAASDAEGDSENEYNWRPQTRLIHELCLQKIREIQDSWMAVVEGGDEAEALAEFITGATAQQILFRCHFASDEDVFAAMVRRNQETFDRLKEKYRSNGREPVMDLKTLPDVGGWYKYSQKQMVDPLPRPDISTVYKGQETEVVVVCKGKKSGTERRIIFSTTASQLYDKLAKARVLIEAVSGEGTSTMKVDGCGTIANQPLKRFSGDNEFLREFLTAERPRFEMHVYLNRLMKVQYGNPLYGTVEHTTYLDAAAKNVKDLMARRMRKLNPEELTRLERVEKILDSLANERSQYVLAGRAAAYVTGRVQDFPPNFEIFLGGRESVSELPRVPHTETIYKYSNVGQHDGQHLIGGIIKVERRNATIEFGIFNSHSKVNTMMAAMNTFESPDERCAIDLGSNKVLEAAWSLNAPQTKRFLQGDNCKRKLEEYCYHETSFYLDSYERPPAEVIALMSAVDEEQQKSLKEYWTGDKVSSVKLYEIYNKHYESIYYAGLMVPGNKFLSEARKTLLRVLNFQHVKDERVQSLVLPRRFRSVEQTTFLHRFDWRAGKYVCFRIVTCKGDQYYVHFKNKETSKVAKAAARLRVIFEYMFKTKVWVVPYCSTDEPATDKLVKVENDQMFFDVTVIFRMLREFW